MARIKDESVDAVKSAANIVDLVEARTRLRKVGGRYTGLCPFHQEKTPSFSVSPDRGTYHCFGCGVGGDAIAFVRETEGLDFVGAIEWLADRFHVPLEYDESSPAADAERRRRERLYALLDQAAAFYERLLWDSDAGAPARDYLASRGLSEDVCREFRLGLSPRGSTLARKAAEKGFDASRARGGRTRHAPRRRLLPAAADVPAHRSARTRDRLPGEEAARGRSAARQVRQLAGERAVPQVERALRPQPRAGRDLEAGPGARGRGQHRRDRASPGRARTCRRVDGDGPDGAAAARARPVDAAALPLLRLGRSRGGRNPARDGARAQAGVRDPGRRTPAWQGPGGRSRRLRGAPRIRRAVRRAPRSTRARPLARPAARLSAGAGRAEHDSGLAGAPRGMAARQRRARTDRAPAGNRRRDLDRRGDLATARGSGGQARAKRARGSPRASRARAGALRARSRALRLRSTTAGSGRRWSAQTGRTTS